jgi:hypothetical protein
MPERYRARATTLSSVKHQETPFLHSILSTLRCSQPTGVLLLYELGVVTSLTMSSLPPELWYMVCMKLVAADKWHELIALFDTCRSMRNLGFFYYVTF